MCFLPLPPSHPHSLSPHTSPPSTPYLYPDASYTLSNIYQATSDVGYYYLRYCLRVPRNVHKQIDANTSYPTEEKKRQAMIAYNLNNTPLACWVTIAGELYYMKIHVSLEAVRKYLHHTTG